MKNRREFAKGLLAVSVACVIGPSKAYADDNDARSDTLSAALARIEKDRGGRLGVAVVDTQTGTSAGYRSQQRFPMCSTFKLLAAAAVLRRVDDGTERLERRIRFAASEVVVNSPVTKAKAGPDGMTLAEICEAAITYSDNTAGNLLLASIGGPQQLTAFARSLGDKVTRLDRIEPDLNEALPNDPRDTTTPAAMLSNLRTLVTGSPLQAASRDRLIAWLLDNQTGAARLRAGLPREWRVGDKTGAGEHGTTNDVAVLWPSPSHAPVFVSVYLTGDPSDGKHASATVAAVGTAIAQWLG
ncbi:MAG TPA: class A beta-lactamase [Paraburkholderia sp.]|nr:class A beta-lactamase [Paraburkholderia sp.]